MCVLRTLRVTVIKDDAANPSDNKASEDFRPFPIPSA